MIGFIIRVISTIIIYLISNFSTFYIFKKIFSYQPSGIMYPLFYILITLIAITIEKIVFSNRETHLIPMLIIIGLSILFY